jgi:oxaloacetate decarboxylase
MHWTPQRERFRAILAGETCMYPASVFDALSARVAESLGFEVGMFPGSLASFAVLGDPDLTLITLTEFAEQAYRICRAGKLPILVDADHGYGNALNVMRTVQELETAGIVGLTIEDTMLPRPFGASGPRLISVEEGVGKMRAAVSARQDPNLVVVGRTLATQVTGIDDAVARVRAYQTTGIDAVLLSGVATRAQIDAVAAVATVPLMFYVTPECDDRDYLSSRKVRIALRRHQTLLGSVQGIYSILKQLRDGVKPAELANLPSAELMKIVTHESDYEAWTKEFLGR